MSELKPCPFCGGEASIRHLCGLFWVGCDTCGGNNSESKGRCCAGCARAFSTPDEAARAWNRRTADVKDAKLRELVKSLYYDLSNDVFPPGWLEEYQADMRELGIEVD